MISKNKLLLFFIIFFTTFFIFTNNAKAATMMLISEKRSIDIDEEVVVYLKIDTGEESINASQGKVSVPTNIFEITDIDTTNSVFNFWVEQPKTPNENGIINFIGGSSKGIAGKSLEVLRINLKASGNGLGEIGLSDAVITASDGKGTNILSNLVATNITVGSEDIKIDEPISNEPPLLVEPTTPVVIPEIIDRPAIPVKNLPIKPVVSVPLYPDSSKWYNHLGDTIVLWGVLNDIVAVAATMNKNPNTVPMVAEKELSTGKNFGLISEDVWYAHVRFKNNIGWGETTHFNISLDTAPPLPFEIEIDAELGDNPSPQITFDVQDEFSGISHALIFVDGQEILNTTSTTITLPTQKPGKHNLLVRVFDQAGNSIEDDLDFEILALLTPVVEFIPKVVSQGEILFASGTAIPSAFVDIIILDKWQQGVFKTTVPSDNSGNWKIAVDKVLPVGTYVLSAIARDERGASSNSSAGKTFKIRPKIILSLGSFINLGWLEIFIIVILLIASGVSIFTLYYVAKKNTREAYKIIIGRDLEKTITTLSDSLLDLENSANLSESARSASVTEHIKRMRDTIAKMKKYIVDQAINKLK